MALLKPVNGKYYPTNAAWVCVWVFWALVIAGVLVYFVRSR
jgi:hypothetical protein